MHDLDETSTLSGKTSATNRMVTPAGDLALPGRWETRLAWAAILLSTVVILAHFVLVLGGGWGGDEFSNFARFQHDGLSSFIARLLHWSPRPSSEVMLYLYSLAVGYWRMPLIAPFLTVLWVMLVGGTVAIAWHRGTPGFLPRLTLALTILTMFLLGHHINDVFYWPMGAAPYLLTVIGITLVSFQVIVGNTSRLGARLVCGLGLTVAATAWETGLFFALSFTIAMLMLELSGLARRQFRGLSSSTWYLVPLAISLAVAGLVGYIIMTVSGRGMGQDSPYFHHFWPSLTATLLDMKSALSLGDGSNAGFRGPSFLVAALLFLGFLWACRSGLGARSPWPHTVALFSGLVGCFTIVTFASYYEYGAKVHEAQETVRQCLIVLALLAVARLVAPFCQWRLLRVVGPVALIGAICMGMITRGPALIADYRLVPKIREARAQTWLNGLDPTTATLRYVVPPQGRVLNGLIPWPSGHFVLGASGTEWWMTGLMNFFGKSGVEFVPLVTNSAK
ncbi:hypothetical protein [Acidisphaera sp. S103]|uniref:hypothetical protein n=1 Tax=Acidisphaera sp. S103 TaxID=1747223 RepID=UPI00131D7F7F|nr:hypothetical protein [Acidisphaera sp. S103]